MEICQMEKIDVIPLAIKTPTQWASDYKRICEQFIGNKPSNEFAKSSVNLLFVVVFYGPPFSLLLLRSPCPF